MASPGPGWTTDPDWVKPGLVLMSLWSVGGTVIIYYAALSNVPKTLYEAARIEGANAWQEFRSVTLPLISGAVFFTLVVNTIYSLQIFAEVYTMFFGKMQSSAGSSAALFLRNLPVPASFRVFCTWATPRRWPGCCLSSF